MYNCSYSTLFPSFGSISIVQRTQYESTEMLTIELSNRKHYYPSFHPFLAWKLLLIRKRHYSLRRAEYKISLCLTTPQPQRLWWPGLGRPTVIVAACRRAVPVVRVGFFHFVHGPNNEALGTEGNEIPYPRLIAHSKHPPTALSRNYKKNQCLCSFVFESGPEGSWWVWLDPFCRIFRWARRHRETIEVPGRQCFIVLSSAIITGSV